MVTFALYHMGTTVVLLRVLYEWQANSIPRGTVSLPIFYVW